MPLMSLNESVLWPQETLIDRRVFLLGDHPVHHDEVTHVMAWRRLMALGALL